MSKNTERYNSQEENEKAAAQIIEGQAEVSESATGQDNVSDSSAVPVSAPSLAPTDDDRFIKFGLVFLVLTLGSFSLWATFAPLSSALIASGEVVVNSYRKSIQHYEGGIVEKIYVRNGDKVAEGDPLIQIDAIQSEAKQLSNEKRLLTAQAELERLVVEQSFGAELVFSDNLLAAAENDPDIKNALLQQQQLHSARLSAFNQEQEALRTRTEQTRQQITGLLAQSAILKEQMVSLQNEQKAYSTLFEEGLGDGQRARELDRSVLSTQNEIARIESEISRLAIQITETDLQIATRKQDYLKDVGERIRQTQNNYYDFQEIQKLANDRIKRSVIRAPEAGIVVDMRIHTLGSVAGPGQVLLDLVPEHDTFVVEAKLMTQDINEVYPGQKADIRFSAFNSRVTKVIQGEVIHVSADRLISERDQFPYYLARIRVTEQGEKDMGDAMELRPGMPAEVMILRGERTLFSYLIKPISDSFARSLKEK
ncbi:MAG: HlyD family type I secretion periplasmic adaptor subunit [Hahellaceae bacterium]|nr:HlyD family type I secretion periplasmic adaptor subunit [Hahellaceae bacterium]MCP5211299.1 HlyD family type I secretion periplasmic adaptor subunit [Hahellaceae bacterium]